MGGQSPERKGVPGGLTAWIVGGSFLLLVVLGQPFVAFALTGVVLIVTAISHYARGRSWASRVVSTSSRKMAAGLGAVGLVCFVVAGSIAPPEVGDQPAEPAASSQAPTPSETAEATPSEEEPSPQPSPAASQEVPDAGAASVVRELGDTDGTAAALLEELEIKGRAPKTGYERDVFGQRWADTDRNGCDTRNDILDRDLAETAYEAGTRDCVVVTGTLVDPFTGSTIDFTRGNDTSTDIQIDHVVALSDAWQKGAQQLDEETRTLFANDPINLLAVDGPTNASKGDGDAATWLPPNTSFRCDYVARQVAVKYKYSLWVTQAEYDAIAGILSGCPEQGLPDADTAPDVTPSAPPTTKAPEPAPITTKPAAPAPAPEPEPTTTEPKEPAADVYYENCTAAREAGAAPILRGEPGYRPAMDRDDDGVACE